MNLYYEEENTAINVFAEVVSMENDLWDLPSSL